MFRLPHHQRIHAILSAMDPAFLESTGCYFGGGTCLALRLGEFRELHKQVVRVAGVRMLTLSLSSPAD